jgi:hypothetical protein
MAFGEEDVTLLEAGRSSDLGGDCWQRLVAHIVRLIDMKLHEVIEVDADIDDRSAVSAESVGKLSGVFDDVCGGIRRGVHAKDGILEIDEDESGLLGVELKFRHESLRRKIVVEIEGNLGLSLLEYEGALDFVKFRPRRSAAGKISSSLCGLSQRRRGAFRRGWL